MFCFKKDPNKALKKAYTVLLTEAFEAQRNGDIKLYTEKTALAADILEKIKG